MFVIMTYDINEKRVAKVHKIMKKYLTWIQNSVFEGEITEAKLRELNYRLKDIIDKTEDSILYWKMSSRKYLNKQNIGIVKNEYDNVI